MLCELTIQDIVLIKQARLSLGHGLSALTGETGAGKSVLLESLCLAMGGKADKGLVRVGAARGIVTASFEVKADHPAWALMAEGGLPREEDDELITLRRVQLADGRSRAFINDQSCSVSLLRAVGASLAEIHGQHQSLGFLGCAAHREVLDHYAETGNERRAVASAWSRFEAAQAALSSLEAEQASAVREADFLRHTVETLEALGPQAGEEAQLAQRRAQLMAAEKVSGDLTEATAILDEDGPHQRLAKAAAQLERAAGHMPDEAASPLRDAVARLDTALEAFDEARRGVVQAAEAFEFDTVELLETEERLFALRAAARKFGKTPDELPDCLASSARALSSLEHSASALAAAQESLEAARAEYETVAKALSARRVAGARRLEKALRAELSPLKLGAVRIKVEVSAEAPGPHGADRVVLLVSTNQGQPFLPLQDVASGGELSRIVLALKAALVAREDKALIVFDEIDQGVGGAVADAVGERLCQLAGTAQVLVVTHSPQVAARAHEHFSIEKKGAKHPTTTVRALRPIERVEEIARMLSGATITTEARAAAQRLLGHDGPGMKAAA